MRVARHQKLVVIFALIFASACGSARDNEPAQLKQPQLTLYPQTVVVSVTPTKALPAFTVPPVPSPISTDDDPMATRRARDVREYDAVKCELLPDGWDCLDTFLEISFKTPFAWRMYKTTLSSGDCGGYFYGYEPPQLGMFHFWGQSKDFCKPTEGTKFAGLGLPQEFCDHFSNAVQCYGIKPNVALAVFFPESNSICNPGPGMFYHPTAWVVTRLNGSRKIDGLLFEREFLSLKSRDQLYQSLSGYPPNSYMCKDETARKKFDEISRQLAKDLLAGKADEETMYLFQQIVDFAKSIKVK